MINLGVIGCGWVASSAHLPVLKRLAGVRLYAACDTRPERLELVRREFAISRLDDDWMRFIADPELDAVLIATPADSHAVMAIAAMEARKHVLVEKPLAVSVEEAEAVAATARRAGVVSMVAFNFRFHPLARQLKLAIERGAVGLPVAVLTTMISSRGQWVSVSGYEASPEREEGVLHHKAVHVVDLLRFLFDCEVVSGRATARSEANPHNAAAIELVLANGVQVLGYFSNHAVSDMTFCVIGEEGKAAVNFTRPFGVALYRREFSRSRVAKLRAYLRQAPRIISAVRLGTPAGRLSSYHGEWEHFLACIRSGSRPLSSLDDGLAATRVVDQLIGSLDRHSDRPAGYEWMGSAGPATPGDA